MLVTFKTITQQQFQLELEEDVTVSECLSWQKHSKGFRSVT